MVVSKAEHNVILSEKLSHFGDEEHYTFYLFREPVTFHLADGTIYTPNQGAIILCAPGQLFSVTKSNAYILMDFFEFELSAKEEQHLLSLPIAIYKPNSPPNLFELSAQIKDLSYNYYSADRYRVEKSVSMLQLFFYCIASGDDAEDDTSHRGIIESKMRQLRCITSAYPTAYGSITEAAHFVGLSRSRFQALFQETFHISYMNDVIRSKIKRACILLQTTDWTVSRIAEELGYEYEAYFYRQFRKQVGVTPLAYRKVNRSAYGYTFNKPHT